MTGRKATIVLLAAGGSVRMGRPKQLLPFKGKTLLWHAASEAIAANLGTVVVVTGEMDPLIRESLAGLQVSYAYNPDWQKGIASSIVTGIRAALTPPPGPEAVLLMVADQPAVTEGLLKKIWLNWKESGKPIAASVYDNQAGTPALFAESLFQELLQLEGDTGAKRILKKYQEELCLLDFPEGGLDIDTPNDYELLKQAME